MRATSVGDAAPRFYIDEDVDEGLAAVLEHLGFDAINTRRAGNRGFRDPRQLLFAVRDERIVVTCNNGDFVLLHEAWCTWSAEWNSPAQKSHPGILVIPNGRELSVRLAGEIIDVLVRREAQLANRLLRWRQSTGWREFQIQSAEM